MSDPCAALALVLSLAAPQSAEDCGYVSPEETRAALAAAAAAGRIPDPALRRLPAVPPSRGSTESSTSAGVAPCLTPAHIHPFEDTDGVLLTEYDPGELFDLMFEGANDVIATWGDEFDFIGFWMNFGPDYELASAFYLPVQNDVLGLGADLYDSHADYGLAGSKLQGLVMMHDVNKPEYQPGTGSEADFVRLLLSHEFEHRFGMFLPPTLDGRELQGDDDTCGRPSHWSWRVDAQGSAMEISDWVGDSPAVLNAWELSWSYDSPGGAYSMPDLYLMGYITPDEIDLYSTEWRYMEGSLCDPVHAGAISDLTAMDVIAAAGPRVPDASGAQKHFRTAWVMIHQPGDAPDAAELDKAVEILTRHQLDWSTNTLGRGTMNDQLFDDCNCNGVPDAIDIATGASLDVDNDEVPDECECGGTTYCTPTITSSGCLPTVSTTGAASASKGDGFLIEATSVEPGNVGVFFYGTKGPANLPMQGGTLCVQGPIKRTPGQLSPQGPTCGGRYSIDFNAYVASGVDAELVAGASVHGQFWFRDPDEPQFGTGLSGAVAFQLCP